MIVMPMGKYDVFPKKEIPATTLRQLLAGLRREYGQHFIQSVRGHAILFSGDTSVPPLALVEHGFDIDISAYGYLGIVPEVTGNEPISLSAIAAKIVVYSGIIKALALSAKAALFLVDAVTLVLQVGLAIGLGMLAQAISPTPTTKDAKQAQKRESSLWNGNQATNIEGSVLPMVFGSPFCGGGVMIANSLTTEDVSLITPTTPIQP